MTVTNLIVVFTSALPTRIRFGFAIRLLTRIGFFANPISMTQPIKLISTQSQNIAIPTWPVSDSDLLAINSFFSFWNRFVRCMKWVSNPPEWEAQIFSFSLIFQILDKFIANLTTNPIFFPLCYVCWWISSKDGLMVWIGLVHIILLPSHLILIPYRMINHYLQGFSLYSKVLKA